MAELMSGGSMGLPREPRLVRGSKTSSRPSRTLTLPKPAS